MFFFSTARRRNHTSRSSRIEESKGIAETTDVLGGGIEERPTVAIGLIIGCETYFTGTPHLHGTNADVPGGENFLERREEWKFLLWRGRKLGRERADQNFPKRFPKVPPA